MTCLVERATHASVRFATLYSNAALGMMIGELHTRIVHNGDTVAVATATRKRAHCQEPR